jgi:hypothetical protein
MATTKKTPPHLAAQAVVDDLAEQERAARARRDAATARLGDLQARNQSGDETVTGLDLMTARADVEAAQGLADHAARELGDARAQAATVLAEHTAQEVRTAITLLDLDRVIQDARRAIEAALSDVNEAMLTRDRMSDEAGRVLAAAGVPTGQWLNGIRYMAAQNPATGRTIPDAFSVEVQTDDGDTSWVSTTGAQRNTRRHLTRVVDDLLSDARSTVPVEPRRRRGGGTVF